MLGRSANLLGALLHAKQRRFVGVAEHHDNHALEQLTASLNQVEVSQGNRVKAARIDCNHSLAKE